MTSDNLLCHVFDRSIQITNCGAITWIHNVAKIFKMYMFNIDTLYSKTLLKSTMMAVSNIRWKSSVSDSLNHPGLRLYKSFKNSVYFEPYLFIKNFKVRQAIAKLRLSCHMLEIENGRQNNVKLETRLCTYCKMNVIESEINSFIYCTYYEKESNRFYSKLILNTDNMASAKLFLHLLLSRDLQHLSLLGKYIQTCFKNRSDSL